MTVFHNKIPILHIQAQRLKFIQSHLLKAFYGNFSFFITYFLQFIMIYAMSIGQDIGCEHLLKTWTK